MNPYEHYHNTQIEFFQPEEMSPAGKIYGHANPLEPYPSAYPPNPFNPVNPTAPFNPMNHQPISPTNELIGQNPVIGGPNVPFQAESLPLGINQNVGISNSPANEVIPSGMPGHDHIKMEVGADAINKPDMHEFDQADFFIDQQDAFDAMIDKDMPFPNNGIARQDDDSDDDTNGQPVIEPFNPKDSQEKPSGNHQGSFSENSQNASISNDEKAERLWNDSDHPDIPKARGRGQRSISKSRRRSFSFNKVIRCVRCGKVSDGMLCRRCVEELLMQEMFNRCRECGSPMIAGRCMNDYCKNAKTACPECGEDIDRLPCPSCGFE